MRFNITLKRNKDSSNRISSHTTKFSQKKEALKSELNDKLFHATLLKKKVLAKSQR